MSDWSTGAVGPHHRAVLCNGVVIAIADDVAFASAIVRTMNQAPRDRHNLQALREGLKQLLTDILTDIGPNGELEDGWSEHAVQRIREVLDGKSE